MKFILILAILITIFIIFVMRRPSAFRIERSKLINASPKTISNVLANFDFDPKWNSFVKSDPVAQYQREGVANGAGSIMHWQGKRSGSGTTEILKANDQHVIRSLNMTKPVKANNTIEFTFALQNGGTYVTWAMYGQNGFVAKLMGVFMNMDKMLDKPFTEGLDDLAKIVEKK